MSNEELAAADRRARRRWKKAFFEAYAAFGTATFTAARYRLGRISTVYLSINTRAIAAGVAYDPRSATK